MGRIKRIAVLGLVFFMIGSQVVYAKSDKKTKYDEYGGGYAITGQLPSVGYSSKIYDASNGLPTSDTMAVMGQSNGPVWIGGYSGVIRYDGTTFNRLNPNQGLTSARFMYEDSKGRIWVGTNDSGVVVIDGESRKQFTYEDGLPSSSIRAFAEDTNGNIIIGTTAGLCFVTPSMKLAIIDDDRLNNARILKLDVEKSGKIYGQSTNGYIFSIINCKIAACFRASELGLPHITTIMADPNNEGKIYIGTSSDAIYHGLFGRHIDKLERISVEPISNVHWLSYDCGRVWVSSTSKVGYLDKDKKLVIVDVPMDSGIEMTTSDYQGNIWVASSTQGAMKIVTNNYEDVSEKVGLKPEVVNAVCDFNGNLYIGTDNGISILDENGIVTEHPLIDFLDGVRIRDIKSDTQGNLWIATYTKDYGVVCYHSDKTIEKFNIQKGLLDNQVRCVSISKDGCVLVGTNEGLAIIKNCEEVTTVGVAQGIKNRVFLTVAEMDDGTILAGSDGDGIYVINGDKISKLGREDGLTSDVITKIIRDDSRDIYWIVTSNSIEYLKDGKITPITTFPYNNNYDIYFDDNGKAWIMSSYGMYSMDADDLYQDDIKEYRIDTVEDGLPYAITGNSYCCMGNDGNLYIPGRYGVIRVDIANYYKEHVNIKIGVNSIYCENERILPNEDGTYTIPAKKGRIQIVPSVLDYTMFNPLVKVYLDGAGDEGITTRKNRLSVLEYTGLPAGDYDLHIQILGDEDKGIIQDETVKVHKEPTMSELLIVRLLIILFLVTFVGYIVWRIMRSTVIQRQYEEIKKAKEEADRANSSKSRFLANMSHEIRTPINTIMGMNEMVLREDATGVPKEYFMSMMNYAFDIRNATESLLGLINDLLDISKIESGKMHLVEQEYDVQEMLRSIVSMIRVKSIEKELTFDVVVDEIMPKRLYGDMGKIKQIVLNLLTNAVKYTEKGGFILNVSMDERENDICMLRFSVKDTGIGVKAEDMDKLFTAYERLDEEKNSAIQGTGLGLDISRRFAEFMDGKLWCESEYGQGSEFILTINQKIVDPTPLGIFLEHENNTSSGPYIPQFIAPDADILVVDDNPMNLSVIKGLLKATRVFVTTSSSGEDALDKIHNNHFDVVLLDHMMPGMDGIETVEKIREFAPDLPVYALTANATAGEDFYVSKGFNGYLSKPVDTEVLEKTILRHLPESMVEKLSREEAVETLTEFPDTMLWIKEIPEISVEDGIRNSGGIESYIFALELFADTIDSNTKVLREAYEGGNIRLYTIKVHALKSSARIIGAKALSELAANLEEAGKGQDMDFINGHADLLLSMYGEFKDKLKGLKSTAINDEGKESIHEDELADAYEALKEVIPMMDFDAVKMIIDGMLEYKLPDEDAIRIGQLEKMLKVFDWDAMEEWLKEGN